MTHRIGVAIGRNGWFAVPLSARGMAVEGAEMRHSATDDVNVDTLASMFESLRADDATPTVAHVVLLPSIAPSRRLDLPRVPRTALRQLLERYAGTYFFGVTEPQITDGLPLARGRRSPAPVHAACAPSEIVRAIVEAAARMNVRIHSMGTAYEAWTEAARRTSGELEGTWVIADAEGLRSAFRLERSRPGEVRVLPHGADPAERIDDFTSERALAIGTVPDGVFRRLEGARWAAQPAEAVAAGFAGCLNGLEMFPPAVRGTRRAARRRYTAAFSAAAAAVLFLAASFELLGARRELDAVSTQRAAIRASVETALDARADLNRVTDQLTALDQVRTGVVAWSRVIAAVARGLPSDAHLFAFRAAGDSVIIDGYAARAAGVFESLQNTPGIGGVRAHAPVRRESRGTETPIERFSAGLRLERRP